MPRGWAAQRSAAQRTLAGADRLGREQRRLHPTRRHRSGGERRRTEGEGREHDGDEVPEGALAGGEPESEHDGSDEVPGCHPDPRPGELVRQVNGPGRHHQVGLRRMWHLVEVGAGPPAGGLDDDRRRVAQDRVSAMSGQRAEGDVDERLAGDDEPDHASGGGRASDQPRAPCRQRSREDQAAHRPGHQATGAHVGDSAGEERHGREEDSAHPAQRHAVLLDRHAHILPDQQAAWPRRVSPGTSPGRRVPLPCAGR